MRTGQKINQTIKYLAIAALLSAGSPELALANPAHPDAGQKEFEILQNHIVDVSDSIKNAVVHIEVLSKRGEKFGKGVGSGVIISPEGQIVTNYHVIDRAQVITVILDDKSKYEAEVWRTDQRTDLAILKVKADKPLPTAPLAETDNVRVGQ